MKRTWLRDSRHFEESHITQRQEPEPGLPCQADCVCLLVLTFNHSAVWPSYTREVPDAPATWVLEEMCELVLGSPF